MNCEPKPAVVCTDGWAGRIETPVTVLRATAKRYECEYAGGVRRLVPQYAVRFTGLHRRYAPTEQADTNRGTEDGRDGTETKNAE